MSPPRNKKEEKGERKNGKEKKGSGEGRGGRGRKSISIKPEKVGREADSATGKGTAAAKRRCFIWNWNK